MSLLAHFEPVVEPPSERRGAPRFRLTLGTVMVPCQSSVVIQDLSRTGTLLEAEANLAPGDVIEVELPEMPEPTVARVAWREGALVGCVFNNPIPKAVISAALLRSVPLTHIEEIKAVSASPDSRGTLKTAAIGALILAGLVYLLLTASMATLVVLGSSLALLFVLLIACCSWALDNTPAV